MVLHLYIEDKGLCSEIFSLKLRKTLDSGGEKKYITTDVNSLEVKHQKEGNVHRELKVKC
jgi:hypothetical protein